MVKIKVDFNSCTVMWAVCVGVCVWVWMLLSCDLTCWFMRCLSPIHARFICHSVCMSAYVSVCVCLSICVSVCVCVEVCFTLGLCVLCLLALVALMPRTQDTRLIANPRAQLWRQTRLITRKLPQNVAHLSLFSLALPRQSANDAFKSKLAAERNCSPLNMPSTWDLRKWRAPRIVAIKSIDYAGGTAKGDGPAAWGLP